MGFRSLAVAAPVAALFSLVSVAVAQRPSRQPEAAAQAPTGPQCRNLNYRGNFRLNGAQQYLTRADAANTEDMRRRNLTDAMRNLVEATGDRATDQLTLWYFFGRAYALQRDYAGADSVWSKVEQLGDADCKAEITRRRRNEWVPLVNQAVELMNARQLDPALDAFRRANIVFRGDPAVFASMANIFLQQEQTDSAVAYYLTAARSGSDPSTAEARSGALLNAARLLHHRLSRPAAAESSYREYLTLKPRDMSAQSDLAAVLTAQNRTQEAAAIYDSLLAHTDSLGSFELFEAGVALFQQHRYEQSTRAFVLGLAKNPHHRDALFNLTNTYVAANDGPNALASARRLVAADSLNRQSWQLLASGYQRVAQLNRTRDSTLRARPQRDSIAAADRYRAATRAYNDSTVLALTRRDSLPVEIAIRRFEPGDSTASVRGSVLNLGANPRPAFNLTIELVNATGEAVARQVVEVPSLASLASHEFTVTVGGRGILAYRYRLN